MKKINISTIACVAALIAGAASCTASNNTPDAYTFSKSGIASVKIGADYASIPDSCPGLYSRTSFMVLCGGEDGSGIQVLCEDDISAEPVVRAILDLDDSAIDALSQRGLDCNYYLINDPRMTDFLTEIGSPKISAITVVPSPHIIVNIDGQEIATTEPARKFMELPGADTTASLGEGIQLTCTVGDLCMRIINAHEALTPEASEIVGKKIAAGMETGMFEPVKVSPSDVKPTARFDYFDY